MNIEILTYHIYSNILFLLDFHHFYQKYRKHFIINFSLYKWRITCTVLAQFNHVQIIEVLQGIGIITIVEGVPKLDMKILLWSVIDVILDALCWTGILVVTIMILKKGLNKVGYMPWVS